MIMKTLNKTYAKFICTVEDSANKGISKRICGNSKDAGSETILLNGKTRTFHDYYVAKMTSLGERF